MWEMFNWEGKKRGARPGTGKGPGGGSHADKHRDKLISSVYPGVAASSPATLLPFFPGSGVGSGMWKRNTGRGGLFPMVLSASYPLPFSPGLYEPLWTTLTSL